MESNEQKIEELKQKGYNPVYIWDAKPNEEDPDHKHQFDMYLLVLEGEIEIKLDNKSIILKSSDDINIPREKVHYGKAGINGCKYIVSERH